MEKKNPVVTIEFENMKPLVLELYPDKAPNTVSNFIALAQSGFYEGTIFHRVISGFMIQGGAGTKPCRTIKGEFTNNQFRNDLKHVRGVISMARTNDPNSASSQFFVMHKDSPHLDANYAAFGMLIDGFETLDAIAGTKTNVSDKPLTPIVMKKVSVDTKGVSYSAPIYCR